MASVEIKLVNVAIQAISGAPIPIAKSQPVGEQLLASSGTSQVSSVVAERADNRSWSIKAIGGAVRVAFGTNPTADNASGWHLSDGERLYLGVSVDGERIAAITAS